MLHSKIRNHRFHLGALYFLQLVSLFPAHSASAYPFTSSSHSSSASLTTEQRPIHFRPPPVFRSVDDIVCTTLVSPKTCMEDTWPSTIPVYEIGDGQIQAPYVVSTDEPALSSSSTAATIVSRNAQAPSISTSTTTVFVVGSRSNAPWPSVEPTPSANSVRSIAQSFTTTVPDESLTSLTTSEVQTATEPPPSDTSGAVQTTLETSGRPSAQPFPTLSQSGSGSLSLVKTATLGSIGPTATANVTSLSAGDIFQPIASDTPPAQISQRSDHPVPRLGIQQQQDKLQTNKFYANFFLGDQTASTWTHPYSLSWSKGSGQSDSWGIAISHIERNQLATGAETSSDAGDWSFFASPVGVQPLIISAVELGAGTMLTTDTLEAFSVNVNLVASGASAPVLTFPLVQGMGFVTGIYNNGTPLLQSGIGIENVTYIGSVINGTAFKYRALLSDGYTWLIYLTPQNSEYDENSFTLLSPVAIQGPSGFGGYIQVAKVPGDTPDAETVYDESAGSYATGVSISGSVQGTTGTYSLSRTKQGASSQPLLIFALPHHLGSFVADTSAGITDVQLVTTTKGMGTAVRGDSWTLFESDLPIDMSFAPWSPSNGNVQTLSAAAIELINGAGTTELSQSVANQTNVGSMYYDGKALAKFAAIVYVLHEMANNATLAITGLVELEKAFALHVNNQQTYPLVYDTEWGGAVSIGSYLDGNPGDDFGNTYYNDHHFHYGYFLYAAAVIGYLDPSWLDQGTNKAWVNMLARDFANPVSDSLYPFSRSFDWYMGHSWAKGLFESADGKDQESSSEDTMASYAIKMWGKIINDKNMEARGNLMLAIQARSLALYFLYNDDNTVEPAEYIGNKVSGIMFENKIDHVTYFGNLIEYIQGIHMLPLMPMSTLIRSTEFVSEEWTAYNFDSYASQVYGGWRGVLMANLAIIDPVTSYNFFSNASGDFTVDMLDGGASQTWYLAWSAALGGSQ